MSAYELHHGDCLAHLRTMADNSVDSIVTDPPYGLSFMGKKWDYDVPSTEIWAECLRVLKPGGHLLAFAGTRTQHRMAVRIEDAGFEIRDMIGWVYGSGFPKSHDVSKAIDKAAGAEREVVGFDPTCRLAVNRNLNDDGWNKVGQQGAAITAPATEAARQWQGWGTALKPALEPITVARKPFAVSVASNVMEWGTGGINIDGCRIKTDDVLRAGSGAVPARHDQEKPRAPGLVAEQHALGRWPANLIHDGSPEVLAGFPETGPAKASMRGIGLTGDDVKVFGKGNPGFDSVRGHEDNGGSAARFFYTAKASQEDRDAGLHGFELKPTTTYGDFRGTENHAPKNANNTRSNTHPTVKPTDLMRYLVRLVTPPGGTVLDPFNGSGSTGKACMLEGFNYIGCELDAGHIAISRARIEYALALRASGASKLAPAAERDAHTVDLFTQAT